MKNDPYKSCLDYAYRLLSYRARSIGEIEAKLKRKGYPRPTIKEVTNRLKELGYLDDLEFARSWVDNRKKAKPRGRKMLASELASKGIDQALIDSVMGELLPPEEEYRLLKGLAKQRLERLPKLDPTTKRKKLYDYLLRRGFSYELVLEVIKDMFKDSE